MTRRSPITHDYRDAGAMSDLVHLYGFVDDAVFLTKSGDLGVVLAQSASQDDVTQQHVDMKARLKNLQADISFYLNHRFLP